MTEFVYLLPKLALNLLIVLCFVGSLHYLLRYPLRQRGPDRFDVEKYRKYKKRTERSFVKKAIPFVVFWALVFLVTLTVLSIIFWYAETEELNKIKDYLIIIKP